MKLKLIFAVLLIIAAGVLFWPKSRPDICRHDEVPSELSEKAVSSAQSAYNAFCEGGLDKAKPLMIKLDRNGYVDQKAILEELRDPCFEKSTVVSPKFDKNLFYVYVPTVDDKTALMVCRQLQNNELKLVSVSWSSK